MATDPAQRMRISPFGDRALLVDLADIGQVHGLWRALRANPPAGAEDIVAGASSVLVIVRSASDLPGAIRAIESSAPVPTARPSGTRVDIPVIYDGPDIRDVCAVAGLSPNALAGRHSEPDYSVAFLGFSPGFGYLVGGDPTLRVPRLASPRPSVPAGSVALASNYTAVYPQTTPGGWRIIGRTDVAMFDPYRNQPSLLSPGDTVRFIPTERVGAAPAWGPTLLRAGPSGYVRVLDAGPFTTIQDEGRIGWAHLGVPRAGAADRRSAMVANGLVGNDSSAALLEATLRGPFLRLGADRLVAFVGAGADVMVDGMPARANTALKLRSGSEIRVGPVETGARVYVAFSGGLDVSPVLGSRSADTLSGVGPPPLKAGDVIPLARDGTSRHGEIRRSDMDATPTPRAGDVITVSAVRGPRPERIDERAMEILTGSVFEVSPTSDRTGIRLSGSPVRIEIGGELPSEGMVPGAIQLPPGGEPIVLLRNHPPTGGYPVAGVVTDAGIDALAQAPPGVRVRLELL